MKLILSRKGFDSQYGGVPSMIMPDGSLCALPVPSYDRRRFRDINYRKENLGRIVSSLTKGRVRGSSRAHLDPDLRRDALPRLRGWRPMFGQVGTAQTHLEKSGVGVGDLFLFFGWFRQTVHLNRRLTYDTKAPHLHVVFGWLQVGTVLKPTVTKRGVPRWAAAHPHVDGAKQRDENNTLYVATKQLRLPGLRRKIPGGGIFGRLTPPLRLTAEGEGRSVWRLPRWFYPNNDKPALTHHSDLGGWKRDATGVLLQTVARGQEFVLDCDYYPEAITWLHDMFASVA